MVITGKTYTNQIYVGSSTSGTAIKVTQAGDPAVGALYNYSGATTLEHGSQYVTSVTGEYWTGNLCGTHWVMNLIVWHTDWGGCAVDQGDSGGPFYFKWTTSPATAGIRGIVNAYTSSHTTCYGMKYSKISSLPWVLDLHRLIPRLAREESSGKQDTLSRARHGRDRVRRMLLRCGSEFSAEERLHLRRLSG